MAYYEKLPSGKWRAQVRDPSGKKVYSPADPLKTVVKRWALETEAAMSRGEWIDPKAGQLTVAAWRKRCVEAGTSAIATAKKNESAWRTHVEPKWGAWPIGSIKYMDCKEWIAELTRTPSRQQSGAARRGAAPKPLGPDMVALAGRVLGQLLEEAVIARLTRSNPMRLVELPSPGVHEDRVISHEEEEQLYAACRDLDREAKARAATSTADQPRWDEFETFLRTLFGTGFRFQEAAGLMRRNVNPLRKRITLGQVLPRDTREVRRDAKTDAGTGRTQPITDALAGELTAHLGRHNEDLVFVTAERRPLHYWNTRNRRWVKVLDRAGLADPQPTLHDIRHTYGTRLADAGVPPHEIGALMGHARLASTERYLHAGEARMERARRALNREDAPHVPHDGQGGRPGKEAGGG